MQTAPNPCDPGTATATRADWELIGQIGTKIFARSIDDLVRELMLRWAICPR